MKTRNLFAAAVESRQLSSVRHQSSLRQAQYSLHVFSLFNEKIKLYIKSSNKYDDDQPLTLFMESMAAFFASCIRSLNSSILPLRVDMFVIFPNGT